MHIKNLFKHLHKTNKHKWYVFINCYKAGIPVRGLLHDLSKYSPTELFEACKGASGHYVHKLRNKHHYEYWQDNFDIGGTPIQMPYKDALELVCDYLGTGMAYQGKKNFSYKAEYEWWLNKKSKGIAMHPHTILFVDLMLQDMVKHNNNSALEVADWFYEYVTERLSE